MILGDVSEHVLEAGDLHTEIPRFVTPVSVGGGEQVLAHWRAGNVLQVVDCFRDCQFNGCVAADEGQHHDIRRVDEPSKYWHLW